MPGGIAEDAISVAVLLTFVVVLIAAFSHQTIWEVIKNIINIIKETFGGNKEE